MVIRGHNSVICQLRVLKLIVVESLTKPPSRRQTPLAALSPLQKCEKVQKKGGTSRRTCDLVSFFQYIILRYQGDKADNEQTFWIMKPYFLWKVLINYCFWQILEFAFETKCGDSMTNLVTKTLNIWRSSTYSNIHLLRFKFSKWLLRSQKRFRAFL